MFVLNMYIYKNMLELKILYHNIQNILLGG